jgi:hypothetical protein
MKVYSACVQADITAAGGDSAKPIVKAVLVSRNNAAVAVVEAVMKAFNASVGGAAPAGDAPADKKGRRDR